jgi:hypothetical protein
MAESKVGQKSEGLMTQMEGFKMNKYERVLKLETI